MQTNDTLLDLLLELEILDRVPRTGFMLRGIDCPESVAEHSFHLATLVWILSRDEPEVDALRALELALVHDLVEVRTGDLPMTAGRYLPEGAKQTGERSAAEELLAPLGDRALTLVDEFEAASTAESRFVRACDKLQLMLKVSVYESWGATGLGEFWEYDGNFRDGEFASVDRLYRQLRSRRGCADGPSEVAAR